MGLPSIVIFFQNKVAAAIKTASVGVAAIILKDDTDTAFDSKVYMASDVIDSADWTATNLDYLNKLRANGVKKVIVERIGTSAADYSAALTRLRNKRWDYMCIPGIASGEVAAVGTWLETQWAAGKTFRGVLPNSVSDSECVINFTMDDIIDGTTTYTTEQYCAVICGILAGMPWGRTATSFKIESIKSLTETTDPDADVDAGKLILVPYDDGGFKIGRGVNSLTTLTSSKGSAFQKIRTIDVICFIKNTIADAFADSYTGQVINTYDNKMLLIANIKNSFFTNVLEKELILDPSYENTLEIDVEYQTTWLKAQGVDTDALSEQEIKKYNTGSNVFLIANIRDTDAMEDLRFGVYLS